MNTPHFGNRVKSRRTLLGLTQDDLAKDVGISQVSIKKIESGGRTRHGRKIAEVLQTTLQWLETGIDPRTDAHGDIDRSRSSVENIAIRQQVEPWPLRLATPERFHALTKDERKTVDAAIDLLLRGIEAARG